MVNFKIGDSVIVWLRPAFTKPIASGTIIGIGDNESVVLQTGPDKDDWFITNLYSIEKVEDFVNVYSR